MDDLGTVTAIPITAALVPVGTLEGVAAVNLDQACSGLLPQIGPTAFWIWLPGSVRSKSNHRNGGSPAARASWSKLQAFERSLSISARAARPSTWQSSELATPLAQRPAAVAALIARSTLDTGNVSKSVLDATQGVLVPNDAQYQAVLEAVERTRSREGLLAGFAQLPARQELCAAVELCTRLATECAALIAR